MHRRIFDPNVFVNFVLLFTWVRTMVAPWSSTQLCRCKTLVSAGRLVDSLQGLPMLIGSGADDQGWPSSSRWSSCSHLASCSSSSSSTLSNSCRKIVWILLASSSLPPRHHFLPLICGVYNVNFRTSCHSSPTRTWWHCILKTHFQACRLCRHCW
jgi:hypothetical protein